MVSGYYESISNFQNPHTYLTMDDLDRLFQGHQSDNRRPLCGPYVWVNHALYGSCYSCMVHAWVMYGSCMGHVDHVWIM